LFRPRVLNYGQTSRRCWSLTMKDQNLSASTKQTRTFNVGLPTFVLLFKWHSNNNSFEACRCFPNSPTKTTHIMYGSQYLNCKSQN
jgi:hypothetical protein